MRCNTAKLKSALHDAELRLRDAQNIRAAPALQIVAAKKSS
jgi:hypothetical protein